MVDAVQLIVHNKVSQLVDYPIWSFEKCSYSFTDKSTATD